MRPIARSILTVTLLLAGFAVSPARAQVDSREGIALQNEIYQLRQDLRTLQDQVARGGGGGGGTPRPTYVAPPSSGGSGDLVAQLLTRVELLEDQVRQLRGQVQQTQNQVDRQGADLGKRIDDLSFQAGQGGGASPPPRSPSGGAPPPLPSGTLAPPPGVAPSQAPSAPPPRTPEIAMQDANAALARHDYQHAEAAAREVLANRTSPRAYDAQIVLAQALAGERQYPQAAIAFDDAYNRSRKGIHAQDALLGLANSLAAINEKKAACDTVTRLRTEFPQARPDVRESAAAIRGRLGCG